MPILFNALNIIKVRYWFTRDSPYSKFVSKTESEHCLGKFIKCNGTKHCLGKLMNGNSKFLDDFSRCFFNNFLPDISEFSNEAIVPLDYSDPIESLFLQKIICNFTRFFKIYQSLIFNIVHNLLGNWRKPLAQFFHGLIFVWGFLIKS